MSHITTVDDYCKNKRENILIFDCDGVLVDSDENFIKFLEDRGYRLDFLAGSSYVNTISLKGKSLIEITGNEVEANKLVWKLFMQFYAIQDNAKIFPAVKGMPEMVNRFQKDGWEVVCLTNFPASYIQDRVSNLIVEGYTIPIIQNTGSKLDKLESIREICTGKMIMIDDQLNNNISALETITKKEMSSAILFCGGAKSFNFKDFFVSSRFTCSDTVKDLEMAIIYYKNKHDIFVECGKQLNISANDFHEMYNKDKTISYSDLLEINENPTLIVNKLTKAFGLLNLKSKILK